MPPMNADRDEHRREDERDGDDRARTSDIALMRRLARRHPLLDVVLDRLDDDDRVVDDEPDRQHEAEERERVDREPEEREDARTRRRATRAR